MTVYSTTVAMDPQPSEGKLIMRMMTESDQRFYDTLDVSLAPGAVEELAAEIARGLDELDDGVLPHLSRVTQEQIDADWCSLTFHVHVSTDLILPVGLYGAPREINPMQVVEHVRDLWPRREALIAAAENSRSALERCLYDLEAEKADVRLRGVGLAPFETWADAGTPGLEAEIDILGDDLRPRRHSIHFQPLSVDEKGFRQLVVTQARRNELRRFLIERGVTGSVDQLTWAALTSLPDPAHVLRHLGRHERIWPTDALYMGWREGRVTSSGEGFQGLSWNGSHIELAGVCLPETILLTAGGRPVTELYTHPPLDPAMIVVRAWLASVEGVAHDQKLVVEIECIDHLFSSPLANVHPVPLSFRCRTHLSRSRPTGDTEESPPES